MHPSIPRSIMKHICMYEKRIYVFLVGLKKGWGVIHPLGESNIFPKKGASFDLPHTHTYGPGHMPATEPVFFKLDMFNYYNC